MPLSFNCPNCSAPLDVDVNAAATIRCPYCNTSVIVPEELRGKSTVSSTISPFQTTVNPITQVDIDAKLDFIKEMALAGYKIVAVKAIRETFAIGLQPAVDLVEAIQRGEQVDLHTLQVLAPASGHSTTLDPAIMQQIITLMRSGDKIGAIKLFRQATNVGLKEAKDAIDGMEVAILSTPDESNTGDIPSTSFPTIRSTANPLAEASKSSGSCILIGFILFIILVTVIPILIGLTSRGGPLAGVWARINPFAIGRVTLSFGKEGTGAGYFTDARFVSVDNNGHIFVGEFDGGRVQVFDENGKYLTQWKATGEESGNVYLSGMAAGRDGAVYTVVGSQLYVYDGMNGNLLGRLDHPSGWGFDDVTFTPDGSVVAAWYKNRDDIIRFDRNGQVKLLLENAIGNVTGDSEMETKVAVDGTGNIYALAYFNEAIFVFSSDGTYISRFGSQGDAKGQFTSPRSIAVDNLGRIYIADSPGIMIYASDGRYLDTLPVNGAVMGMTFDDQNNLYVVANEQVLRFKLK
jgi:ribosomal protein L7/L12/sugar lactone lactonase YvrE/DNA-directed RNA polymerase subunit RPC12/RpoP